MLTIKHTVYKMYVYIRKYVHAYLQYTNVYLPKCPSHTQAAVQCATINVNQRCQTSVASARSCLLKQ